MCLHGSLLGKQILIFENSLRAANITTRQFESLFIRLYRDRDHIPQHNIFIGFSKFFLSECCTNIF